MLSEVYIDLAKYSVDLICYLFAFVSWLQWLLTLWFTCYFQHSMGQSKFWYQIFERCRQIWMKKYLEFCCEMSFFHLRLKLIQDLRSRKLQVTSQIRPNVFFHCHIRKQKDVQSVPKILQCWAIDCETHSPPTTISTMMICKSSQANWRVPNQSTQTWPSWHVACVT